MKGTFNLSNPIKIDGKDVNTLTYDTNEISSELFAEAEAKKLTAASKSTGRAGAVELDYSLHLYVGLASIVAVNSNYSFEDVARIKGHDIVEVMKVGRNFIMRSENSQDADSDEQSETSPASTTPASQTSKKSASPTS